MANMLPNIISGVVILVAVICIIVGAKKGFAKLFSKNICILIAMAGAGVLSFLVSGKFAFLMEFENSITTLLLEKLIGRAHV